MKSLAAVLVEQKRPLELIELEIPEPKLGQLKVRVLASGICGSQLGEIDGVKGPDRFLPHLLGHEATAEVLECGEGVRSVKPGDRVVLHWRKGAGLESVAPRYASSIGPINAGWVTTFNEIAIVSENRATKIPSSVPLEVGALFGCAVTTAFGVVCNDARVALGESVAVFGAGGIGLNIVQGAAMAGAYPIIAIDRFANRLELARALGATHTIDTTTSDVRDEIARILGSEGLDVAIENTGNVGLIESAYALTSARGRTILVGVPPKGTAASIATLPLHFEKRLSGSHGGDARPDLDIPRFVRLLDAGKLALEGLVGRRYGLGQVNDAIDDMRSGRLAGRAMLMMDGSIAS